MPVGLTKCAPTHSTISRHLMLFSQLGKYLLYECDYPGPASYPRIADRPLRVCHPISLLYAIPNARCPPDHGTLTRSRVPCATSIRRWHARLAVLCLSPSTRCFKLRFLSSQSATVREPASHNKVLLLLYLVIYEAKIIQTRRSVGPR
jgi:hypothetical protein